MILIYDKNEKIDLRTMAMAHFVCVVDSENATFSIIKDRKTGKLYDDLKFENFLREIAVATDYFSTLIETENKKDK